MALQRFGEKKEEKPQGRKNGEGPGQQQDAIYDAVRDVISPEDTIANILNILQTKYRNEAVKVEGPTIAALLKSVKSVADLSKLPPHEIDSHGFPQNFLCALSGLLGEEGRA